MFHVKPRKKKACSRCRKPFQKNDLNSDPFKLVLAYATGGADPIFGKILESGAGCDPAIRVANGRIIFITTYRAYVFSHLQ